jgi:anti-sigma factor RsiW
MSDWIPSDEQLGAYFDEELSEADRNRVEAFLTTSPPARTLLDDFRTLQELGPMVDDRMPSALYWEDLPDRVLARIASEGRTDALLEARGGRTEPASRPRWWERLASPAGRWATATAAVAVVGLGAYWITQGGPGAADSIAKDSGTIGAASPEAIPVSPLTAAGNPEEAYRAETQRVFRTLGTGGRLGETMDVLPGAAAISSPAGQSPIQRVSLGAMDQSQTRVASPVVRPGAGPTDAEWFFMSAIKHEKMGNCDLAQKGYRLVQANTIPQDPLNVAAGAGLTRCAWRKKIHAAGAESTKTLNSLAGQAEKMYAAHAAGHHQDCARAWQLMVSYLDLARSHVPPETVLALQARIDDIGRCVE